MNRFAGAPWWARAVLLAGLGLAGAALLAGLAATVALAGLGRMSADVDPANASAWLWYFRHDPDVARWLRIGGLTSAMTAAIAGVAFTAQVRRPLHGDARWARLGDLRRAGLRAETGIILGRRGGGLLTFGGAEHVLLYAPTRSGKGVGVVIPNLLAWPGSVVVLDVKRENWAATAGFRAAHGQTVHLFDPLDPEGRTARYNPLGHIDRRDPIAVLDELQKIAVMLLPTPPTSDPFWAEAARTGFIGVGAMVAESPELAFTLGVIYREITRGDVRARLTARIAERARDGRPFSPGCVQALADFCDTAENTFASVRQTLSTRLNLWLNPRVCAATAASDFDLQTLRARPQSIYLATSPDNLARVAPLYGLVAQQLVDLNTREAPDPEAHPVQVLVLLDEFARLGHAAVLARAFSYVAGYGLRLLPVLQSPAQLRQEYGPDLAEEIISNCGVEVVFTPKDLRLARELSGRLGDTTVRTLSRSRPSGLSPGHRSVSETDQRRPLLLPQEVLQLPPCDLIVLRAGAPPVRGRKIVYWRERAFMRRLLPAPIVPVRAAGPVGEVDAGGAVDLLGIADIAPMLAASGLEPPPPEGATSAMVEAWVDRFLDATTPAHERDHA